MNLPLSFNTEYICRSNVNLYSSVECQGLASQAAAGRHLKILKVATEHQVVRVRTVEDDYPGWLRVHDLAYLEPAHHVYEPAVITRSAIERKLRAVIEFAKAAQSVPNQYLWGGTVAPNYDCSGLVQAAFAAQGIWLPRDSYQQEAFTQRIPIDALEPGDLIFFGTPTKTDHVALYLGERRYIHSSGREMGRNGIGIDTLAVEATDPISLGYWWKFRCAGRVMLSYQRLGCGH